MEKPINTSTTGGMNMEEPAIAINGERITDGQAMTIRVALTSFGIDMQTNGLGDDEHGKAMASAYLERVRELESMWVGK